MRRSALCRLPSHVPGSCHVPVTYRPRACYLPRAVAAADAHVCARRASRRVWAERGGARQRGRYDCVQMSLLNSRDRGVLRGLSDEQIMTQ